MSTQAAPVMQTVTGVRSEQAEPVDGEQRQRLTARDPEATRAAGLALAERLGPGEFGL